MVCAVLGLYTLSSVGAGAWSTSIDVANLVGYT
jgi:hypothetical protein